MLLSELVIPVVSALATIAETDTTPLAKVNVAAAIGAAATAECALNWNGFQKGLDRWAGEGRDPETMKQAARELWKTMALHAVSTSAF